MDKRDPDYQQHRTDKKWRLDQLWLQGKIGDATYLRSLFIDGFHSAEANTELHLLRMEKQRSSNMKSTR